MFQSTQSKVIMGLAIPVILVTQYTGFSIKQLLTQLFIYLSISYNADCLVGGQCKFWAWISLLFPIIYSIGYLFFTDKLSVRPPIRLPTPRQFRVKIKTNEEAKV